MNKVIKRNKKGGYLPCKFSKGSERVKLAHNN